MTITCPRGDTLRFAVEAHDDASPVDLTDATIICHIWARATEPLLILTVGDGITVETAVQVGEAPAVFAVEVTAAQTDLLPVGRLTVESKVRWSDGTVSLTSHDQLIIGASSIGAAV
jgi:hypothetical protein